MKNLKNTNQFQDEEIWKPIKGFEGKYAVSNRGRVMNLKTGRVLKHRIDGIGYEYVSLCRSNGTKPKNITIHRLIATTFIDNPDNLPEVNHIDECKTNNNIENLEWVSASQNQRHSAHTKSCRINQLTLNGELVKEWDSAHEIERELGFANNHIIAVCKGKYKQGYGFKWEYSDPEQQRKVNRPVAALTMDGDLICEYKNAAEAARSLKIRDNAIHYCLKGIYKSTNGLKFIYI